MPDHLPLRKFDFEASRRKRPGFAPGTYRDFEKHSKKLQRQITGVLSNFHDNPPPKGINPALILRLSLVGFIDEDEWRKAGLTLVGQEDKNTLVLFASDEKLERFQKELALYQGGPQEGRKNAPYAGIFNNIEEVRQLSPADRIGRQFKQDGFLALANFKPKTLYTVDLELWHTGDVKQCHARMKELRKFVEARGGRIPDNYIGPSLVLARIKGPGSLVRELLDLEIVSTIDIPPRVSLKITSQLDTALWRRFDEIIKFPRPNKNDIVKLLKLKLKNFPVEGLDFSNLAPKLKAFSHSEIEWICSDAIKSAVLRNADLVTPSIFEESLNRQRDRLQIRRSVNIKDE